MIERVRAKMHCTAGGNEVRMQAVYSQTGENADFADATPSGDLRMMISPGRPAAEFFQPGKTYYVDFTEAPPL